MKYAVYWTETNRRKIEVEAPGPEEAQEAFWNVYHDLNSDRFPIGQLLETSEPQSIAVLQARPDK